MEPLTRSPRRRPRPLTLGALVVLLALFVAPLAPHAAAQSSDDPRAERERVRAEQAQVASEVDALQADADEVASALAALESDVATQRAALSDAQRALDSAEAELGRLDGQIADTEAQAEALRSELKGFAVAAYVQPPVSDGFGALDATSAEESARKRVFLEMKGRDGADVVDQLRGTEAQLRDQRAEAEQVRAEAEAHRADVRSRAQQVESSYARQADYSAQVEGRLNARLAESQSLAALDSQLSDKIAAEEAAVAARLAASRQREADEAARAQAAAQAAAASSSTTTGSGSSTTSSTAGGSTTTVPSGPITPPSIVGSGQIVTVGGISVNRSIAGNLQSLLSAASASGINLAGTGWRDPQQQIELRRQHCGTSDYAVYQMSPDACSPPTAIPGRSKHEQGLAVDFSCNGSIINSRSSPCFQWLAANAGSYGFVNLPSEPWHWSNDGG